MKAVFLDRDGTVIKGIPHYDRVDSADKVELFAETIPALKILAELGWPVFFVTNQAGVAEGLITMADFGQINQRVLTLIEPSGIKITKTYLCPHAVNGDCECRKPKPKLLLDAAKEFGIDLAESWMLGDRETDVQTGKNAGTKTILVETGGPVDVSEADYRAKNLLDAAKYIKSHSG
ncbi:MAG TPA: HAD family hydrolase [Candidatus Saccharimonadia bacterium]|nr:HAD family hydrolase [Candidatus Saccharimonadia bacterium]